ncbi:MAG: GH116 family glycosyl-hydrolase [Armatimonadia bacterium]
MSKQSTLAWPVLRSYTGRNLRRIALPLGGIGTGTVSLGGRGDLRDWEIMNRPAKGYTPDRAFFAIWVQAEGQEAVTRCLEGPIDPEDYEGASGSNVPNHGLPRFRKCTFHAAYPLAQLEFADASVPVRVRLEAFNPLVPSDSDASGHPVAVLRYVVTNPTKKALSVALCGTVPNLIGADGSSGVPVRNRNSFRKGGGLQGIFMSSEGVCTEGPQWGTMALSLMGEKGVTYREVWHQEGWNTDLLHFWDDFSADGKLDNVPAMPQENNFLRGSLATQFELAPGETRTVTFLLTWHFPNRLTWSPKPAPEGKCCDPSDWIGNYYTTKSKDAWDAAVKVAKALPELERRTVGFVRAFCDSDLPGVVKEAALFNLSTLRSETCFRTPDGRFYAWEGCQDRGGCCHGSCTHVWNYEQSTGFLFGDLARTMREVEFLHATDAEGRMAFRVGLPLGERAQEFGLAAADGQMGCLMKLYRDWQLSGDSRLLKEAWPAAKRALEFCWIPGGWDADQDGVMEGCQHNTMDVEYYGPNGQMGTWYLGALRACEEMARQVGEADFAERCRSLFERGSKWMDENLFNGQYYEHLVWPLREDQIAKGLRHPGMGARNLADPDFQLGAACLVDQLVGQYFAHVCGLGYLTKPGNVKKTLRSIMKYNFRPSLQGHFNNMRTYALGDEAALLMSTYPLGRRPKRPFPYANEVMTGFEYTAAVGMLYEGLTEDGLRCIAAIRERYDGLRRSPFDEAECGHHYGRAMAAWAAVPCLAGFQYSGVTGTMTFAATAGKHFWSTGNAFGTCEIKQSAKGYAVKLRVVEGKVKVRRVELKGAGASDVGKLTALGAGDELKVPVRAGS